MNKTQTVNSDGVVIQVFGAPCPLKPRAPRETRSECGSPFIHRAALSFKDNGEKVAQIGEKLDLDAMIQAALPSTDMAAIVARAKMGDDSVLHISAGFVGDAVSMPKDLYDYKRMNDLYDKVSGSFDTLPSEIKALFGNSTEEYLNSILSNKAEEIIQKYKDSQQSSENQPEGGNQ